MFRLEKHYFTSAGASLMGPPHQPVLFLAAAVERGRLWGGVSEVVYKGESTKKEEGRGMKVGRREGQRKPETGVCC